MELGRIAREGAGWTWAIFEGGLAVVLVLAMAASVIGLGWVVITAVV